MEKKRKEKTKQEKQKIYSSIFFFSRTSAFGKEEKTLLTTNKTCNFHFNTEGNQNYRLGSAKISVEWPEKALQLEIQEIVGN